jgi:hypothetical protein
LNLKSKIEREMMMMVVVVVMVIFQWHNSPLLGLGCLAVRFLDHAGLLG